MASRTCELTQEICTVWRVWWLVYDTWITWFLDFVLHLLFSKDWSFTMFGWYVEFVRLVASDGRSYSQSLVHCCRNTWFLTRPCLVWTECNILEIGSASMLRWIDGSDGRSCSQSVLPSHPFNWWWKIILCQVCLFWNTNWVKSRSYHKMISTWGVYLIPDWF